MMKNRSIFILIILLLVGSLVGCQEQQKPQEFSAIPVKPYTVGKQSFSKKERFYGEIMGKETVTISSTIPGRIQLAPQMNGAEVDKGQTLFKIENKDLQSAVLQAQSAVGVSQANLEKIKAGPSDHEILALEENVQSAKVGYETSSQNAERMKVLFESGAISQQQHEQAQTEQKMAESKYKSLFHQLNQMKAGPSEEAIQLGKSQVQQSQAAYQAASSKMQELIVQSPVSGFISNLQADEGEYVNPGMPLATIHNIGQVYVQVQIPESMYLGLNQGEQVEVNIPLINKTYSGKITELNPQADMKTKLFSIKILLNNEKKMLKPGMTAEVDIETAHKSEAVIIPLDAVINDKGKSVVYVIEDETARKKTIEAGVRTDVGIEVLSGLRIGEKIIREGVEFVGDGDQIEVLMEGSE